MVEREFVEYENDEGGKVMAHRVTKETEGRVSLVGGGKHDLREGEVLVQSQNSNMYDVYPGRTFDEMFTGRSDGTEEERLYNPSDYTAKEVRTHLETLLEDGDEEEYERVVEAERHGKNRKGAFPAE